MVDSISDDLWASLRTLLPELECEDRGRIDGSIRAYRARLDCYSLSASTKREVKTIRSQTARLAQRIERLYAKSDFLAAGVNEISPAPKLDSMKHAVATMGSLLKELDDAEVRFARLPRRLLNEPGDALERLVSQLLYLVCEKKCAEPPIAWREAANGIRFHEFIRCCVDHATDGKIKKEELDIAGQRATKEVHELGKEWGELVGPDI